MSNELQDSNLEKSIHAYLQEVEETMNWIDGVVEEMQERLRKLNGLYEHTIPRFRDGLCKPHVVMQQLQARVDFYWGEE